MDKASENMECVKSFNNELASLYECKPPISKAKMVQITKLAMKAIKYYKHVVMSVEKFIQKCRPEYKLPGLYVIDSIVRQSRHQHGVEKDVFVPRFAKNIAVTFQSLFKCPDEDKIRIVRVIRLWMKNGVFAEDDMRPLLQIAAGLGVDVPDVGDQNGKGDSVKNRRSPSPQEVTVLDHDATTDDIHRRSDQQTSDRPSNLDPSMISQLQKLTSVLINNNQSQRVESDRKLTQKLLADYEYSDEESGGEDAPMSQPSTANASQNDLSANLAAAAQNLLKNPELLQQIHEMQQSMRGPGVQGLAQLSSEGHQRFQHPPPPAVLSIQQQQQSRSDFHLRPSGQRTFSQSTASPPPQPPFVLAQDNQASNYPPPAEPLPPEAYGRPHWPTNMASERLLDKDERKRGPESTRRRSRSRSRDRRRRSSRSRSRSRSGSRSGKKRNRSRSNDRRGRDQERERRKQGLPPIKSKYVSVCSRTLWFGRVPTYCEAHEIKEGLKDYGEPQSIDLITPRGCAYVVMPDRKSAFKVLDRLRDSLRIQNRTLKMAWAPGKGVKEYKDGWDVDNGVTYLPWDCLPADLTALLDGGGLDVDSLPEELKGSYTESGKVGATTTSVQPQFAPVPPPFPAFAGVPPPNVFAEGILPTSYPPLSLGPGSSGTAVLNIPPPTVPPPSLTASGIRLPLPSAPGIMNETAAHQIKSLVAPMSLYGHGGQAPVNPPPHLPPNYARPVNLMDAQAFGRPRFQYGNQRGGRFDGGAPPPPPGSFRGRGRGMRGGGDFRRGNSFRGGGLGPRMDWSAPQPSSRFDGGVGNGRSRWSGSGEGRFSQDYASEEITIPRRSRWSTDNNTMPPGFSDTEPMVMRGGVIPVISSTSWQSTGDQGSEEPPPPGE